MRTGRVRNLHNRGVLTVSLFLGMFLMCAVFPGHIAAALAAVPYPAGDGNATLLNPPILSSPSLVEGTTGKPTQPAVNRERVREALLKEDFSYNQYKLPDPFVSFITPVEAAPAQAPPVEEEFEPPPEPQRPLTPLQKMNLGEIEGGLKAIVWGELGRRALIEDSAGKGYIVGVGTPAGERSGVITVIFNDHIVIQQQIWDRKARRMTPQNFVVKLKKQQTPK